MFLWSLLLRVKEIKIQPVSCTIIIIELYHMICKLVDTATAEAYIPVASGTKAQEQDPARQLCVYNYIIETLYSCT